MNLLKPIFFSFLFLMLTSSFLFSQEEDDIITQKIKVNDVDLSFNGTESFDKNEITAIIKTGNSEFFNYEDFLMDIKRIEKFYFDNGYFDAFVDTSLSVDSKSGVNVKFIISEKKPFIIQKINYLGLENLPDNYRKEIFGENKSDLSENEIYNKNNINAENVRVAKYLQNNGYAFSFANPPEIVRYQSQNPDLAQKVIVNFNYTLGNNYRCGKTKININNNRYNLKLEDIIDELEYAENDIYSKEKIVLSENRLNRIAILENPRVLVSDIDTVGNIINFTINSSIRNKYELQPELLGYDIDNLFFAGLGLSFSDRYFLRNARTFTSKLRALANSVDQYRLEFIMELQQPHIFRNNKITGNWNMSYVLYSLNEFRVGIAKNKFTINYELPKHTYFNNLALDWKISNERFVLKVPLTDTASGTAVLEPGFFTNFLNSALGLSVVHTSIDNFQFPARGFYQLYFLEECGLLSSLVKKIFSVSTINYIKFSFLNKLYLPVTSNPQKSVLASKFMIGDIYQYRESDNMQELTINFLPLDYKFIAGGSTSVRGWGARKLGTFPEKDFGGNFIIEGSIEHRTRPFLDKKGLIKDLGFVTFFDYGNLWKEAKNFTINSIALAIGAGLRYYTIVGPIRFDLGFKLYDYDPSPGTAKWLFKNRAADIFSNKLAFQFGIGNTF
ncbi:MAG: BamA/TamA family outer membrane protein [Ignavibacteria bacterium]|nr:BamA/TamA family outer membrane protein [Ignavibacteria bacterium]